jgi:hypothetical protein
LELNTLIRSRSLGGGEGPEINLFGAEHVDSLALAARSLGGGEGPEINLFGAEHIDSVAPARTATRDDRPGDYGIWTSTPAGRKKAA